MNLIKLLISKIKLKIKNYKQEKELKQIFNIKDPFIYK